MSSNTARDGHKDSELQALKHELEVEILNDLNLIGAEFHDHEDLIFVCYPNRYTRLRGSVCLCLNIRVVRGGEFLHE